jgi:hypothetical protein
MGLKFKNALTAFFLLLFCTIFTSCQKDHDLVSSYVIKSPSPIKEYIVEVPETLEGNSNLMAREEKELKK